MATRIAKYSTSAVDALSGYKPPKTTPVVTFQSVAPGTSVRQGETINVRLVSESDVPLGAVASSAEDIPQAANITLADFNDFADSQNVKEILDDPTLAEDAAKKAQIAEDFSQRFGGTLTAAQQDSLIDAVFMLYK